MKNTSRFLFILIVLILLMTCMVACKENEATIASPEGLAVNGAMFSWNSVEGAEGYEVVVDENDPVPTINTYYEVDMSELRTYSLKVRAFKTGEKGEKVYSEYATISHTKTNKLAKPSNVAFDLENSKLVKWDPVENASSYLLNIFNDKNVLLDTVSTTSTSFSFDESSVNEEDRKYSSTGRYTLYIMARPGENNPTYVSSESVSIVYCVQKVLAAPNMSGITTTSVRWESIGGATSYKLFVYYDNPDGDDILVNEFTTTSTSYAISNFDLKTNGHGTYYCKVQAIGDTGENKVYLTSDISERDTKYDLWVLPALRQSDITLSEVAGKTQIEVKLNYLYNLSSISISLQTTTASGSSQLSSIEKTLFAQDATTTYFETLDAVANKLKHYYTNTPGYYTLATTYDSGATFYTKNGEGVYTEANVESEEVFNAGEYYVYTPDKYIEAIGEDVYTQVGENEEFDKSKVYYIHNGVSYVISAITKFEDGVTYYTKSTADLVFLPGVTYYEVDEVVFTFDLDDLFENKDDKSYYGKLFTITTTVVGSSNSVISPTTIVLEEKYLSYKKPEVVDNSKEFEEAPEEIKAMFAGKENYQAKYREFVDAYNGWYYITSMGELQYLRIDALSNYVVVCDLDNELYEWNPIANFDGILDGYNHSISNLIYCEDDSVLDQQLGLINTNRGTIKNLFVINVKTLITGPKTGMLGGIVCENEGTIENCFVSGTLTSIENIGGIVAENSNSGIIKNSQSITTITAQSVAGGIAGFNYGTIIGSYSTKDITAKEALFLVGDFEALKAYYEGDNTTEIYVKTDDEYESIGVYTDGKYEKENGDKYDAYYVYGSRIAYVGGLVGHNTGDINNSFALGNVEAKAKDIAYAGGLIGYSESGTIEKCYAGEKFSLDPTKRSLVSSEAAVAAAGGFVGRIEAGSITNSYSTSRTVASDNFGGFVGYNVSATISYCYSTGGTSSQSSINKGAFVGNNTGTIDNCYFYNYFASENYNNIDSCAEQCASLAIVAEKLASTGAFNTLLYSDSSIDDSDKYREPTLTGLIYTQEYELQKGSGGYINEGAYLVDLDKVTNITADENVEYITIGDNTRKGTIVVVLATDTARVAFLVTVK